MNPSFDISVVVSSYNRDDKVLQSLQRLFESDLSAFTKLELLVIDDGSPRPLKELLSAIHSVPEKMEWRLITQANAGIGATRNRGYREAKAPLVIFLDDDILVHTNTLQLLYASQQNGPGPIIFGNYPFITHASGSLQKFAEQLYGYHSVDTEVRYTKVDAITSGLLVVNKSRLPDPDHFYKDDLSVPAAEEYEIVARFSRLGIPIYMAAHIHAIHNHHLELPWLVQQQYKYGLGTAEAFIKYPDCNSLDRFAALKKNLDAQQSGLRSLPKRLLASAWGRKLIMGWARLRGVEKSSKNHNRLIGILTSAYFWAGYRDGLKKFRPAT